MTRAKAIIKQVAERNGENPSTVAALALENPFAHDLHEYRNEISSLVETSVTVAPEHINNAIVEVLRCADVWSPADDQVFIENDEDENNDDEREEDEEEEEIE